MAGGELYGVWVQTITNDTTAANVEKYGEIEDMAQAYRDGFAKDFCDGQTSPTPPRWPDDGMQLIYTYDPESARLISEFLRGDISERIEAGMLVPSGPAPTWASDAALRLLGATTETAATVASATEAAAITEPEAGFSVLRSARARLNIDDAASMLQERGLRLEPLGWQDGETMYALKDSTGKTITTNARSLIRFLTTDQPRPDDWL